MKLLVITSVCSVVIDILRACVRACVRARASRHYSPGWALASSNRSTTDQIFYIRQILEKKWECNGKLHQIFIDFKKAYDSVKGEVLYNILVEFGIPKKPIRIIKMCLNET
jgi:hypothetical protein